MTKTPKYQSVKEYFEQQPAETVKQLFALKTIIQEVVPEGEELLNYEMPAYSLTKGGKRDKQIMIAGYKKFVSIYVGNNILNNFQNDLTEFTVGKASIQFPIDKPLPEKLIRQIILYKLNNVK